MLLRKLLGPQVPIERSYCRIPRLAGSLACFWPEQPRMWWVVVLFCVNTFAVGLGAVGENLYGFMNLNDLFSALEAFCPGITKAISLLKMLTFFAQRQRWKDLVLRIRAMLTQDENVEKRRIAEQLASVASILSFILLMSGSCTNAFFNLLPIIKNLYRLWQGNETERMLPFNIALPEMFRDYPYYPYTYAMLTLSGAMTVFTFSAVDGFFLCGCMYICGLFRMLEYDLRELFGKLKNTEFATPQQNHVIRQRLGALVERHNTIYSLCTDLRDYFALIVLMHFLSASLVLCFSILNLLLNSSSVGVLTYISYSIAALTQLFLYCIGGSYVSESSVAVSDTLYTVEWYNCDVQTRKMLLVMLLRAQRAKTVAVPFFTPSLPAFTSIISTAGSYITLLKTFL